MILVLLLLAEKQFNPTLQQKIVAIIDKVMSPYIYTTSNTDEILGRRIVVQNTQTGEKEELRSRDVVSLVVAQKNLVTEFLNLEEFNIEEKKELANTFKQFLAANLRYSDSLTTAAKTLARQQVTPLEVQFRKKSNSS
ncbi:MAG: hypothetical protein IPK14_16340 [Blastocatellia bacterium]|nr:hypothetical protein [Blastocatellia bacterium]